MKVGLHLEDDLLLEMFSEAEYLHPQTSPS